MVESNCQFTMQVSDEIRVARRSVFEANNNVIVIGKESPRL